MQKAMLAAGITIHLYVMHLSVATLNKKCMVLSCRKLDDQHGAHATRRSRTLHSEAVVKAHRGQSEGEAGSGREQGQEG